MNRYPRELLIHKFLYRLSTHDRFNNDKDSMLYPVSLIMPIMDNNPNNRNRMSCFLIDALNKMKVFYKKPNEDTGETTFENVVEIQIDGNKATAIIKDSNGVTFSATLINPTYDPYYNKNLCGSDMNIVGFGKNDPISVVTIDHITKISDVLKDKIRYKNLCRLSDKIREEIKCQEEIIKPKNFATFLRKLKNGNKNKKASFSYKSFANEKEVEEYVMDAYNEITQINSPFFEFQLADKKYNRQEVNKLIFHKNINQNQNNYET